MRSDMKPKVISHCPRERAQAVAMFAVFMTVIAVFTVGIVDYMISTSRAMQAIGIVDLAAHAGVQEVNVLPDGSVRINASRAQAVAIAYFNQNVPQNQNQIRLVSVTCYMDQARPACLVEAEVASAGLLIPQKWISVRSVAYLAYGVTRGDQ